MSSQKNWEQSAYSKLKVIAFRFESVAGAYKL